MKWRYEKYSEAGVVRHKIYGGAIADPDTLGRSYIIEILAFDRYKGKLEEKETVMHRRNDEDPNADIICNVIETALKQADKLMED